MYSVVVTTKDRPTYLLRCLESIAHSTILPYDVVIINDGGEKIEKSSYTSLKLDLTIINHDESKGANYCRNLGVSLSKKEIVFFLDDDDAVSPISFESRLRLFSIDESIGLVYTGIKIVLSSELSKVKRISLPHSSDNYLRDLLTIGNVVGSTSRVAIRKNYFYQAGGFDEELQCMQDYDLWIRMSKKCRFANDKNANVYYTVHEEGKQISSNYEKYICAGKYMESKYLDELVKLSAIKAFRSNVYMKVASSIGSRSTYLRCSYALRAFLLKPRIKSIFVAFLPGYLLKKVLGII
ncbi:glycosyltransferase family 2 protein [Vibrio sp. PNB22_4_1]